MEKCCICTRETENGVYIRRSGDVEAFCPNCLAFSQDERAKLARDKVKKQKRSTLNIKPDEKEDWAPFSSRDNIMATKKVRRVR
jgi:hypothetical protein|nr:MAG TPA_asm: hypothetical protein [Caudoviricetes sp.]